MAEKTGIEELRVKEILKERGMKMYELAEQMNIAPESLTRALQRNPQYSTLKTIADTLGVSVRDLFKGDDTQASNNEMRGCIFYGGEMYTFNSRKEIEKFLIDTK
jgi:transcriptional regulator with XRE-family HTH domain